MTLILGGWPIGIPAVFTLLVRSVNHFTGIFLPKAIAKQNSYKQLRGIRELLEVLTLQSQKKY